MLKNLGFVNAKAITCINKLPILSKVNSIPKGTYKIVVKLFNKKSDLTNIPFSVSIFSGDLVKTQVFNFNEATSKDTIEIANLTFKKGKLLSHRIFR